VRDEKQASAFAPTERGSLLGPLHDYLSRSAVRWRHECTGFGWLAQGHDHTWWLNRLRELKGDPVAMGALRSLLARRAPALSPTSDEQMLMQAALALECGELRLCGREETRKVWGGPGGEAPEAVPSAAPEPRPRTRPSAPPPEPDSLSPGAAHGSIAESHREAARLGIALCEECLKRAAAGGAP